jgi:hypothetical protein
MTQRKDNKMKLGAMIAAAALCALPAAGFAQDWKAEMAKVVAAAEAEGQLVMMSQPNQAARDFLSRGARTCP